MLYFEMPEQTNRFTIMRTQLIEQLVSEYKANPNCWPDLWIQGEGLNKDEQKEFINRCL